MNLPDRDTRSDSPGRPTLAFRRAFLKVTLFLLALVVAEVVLHYVVPDAQAASPLEFVDDLVLGQASTAEPNGEVLVQTSATEIPKLAGRKSIEVQNRADTNSIFCAIGKSANATGTAGREVKAGESWTVDTPLRMYCSSPDGAQTAPKGTRWTQDVY